MARRFDNGGDVAVAKARSTVALSAPPPPSRLVYNLGWGRDVFVPQTKGTPGFVPDLELEDDDELPAPVGRVTYRGSTASSADDEVSEAVTTKGENSPPKAKAKAAPTMPTPTAKTMGKPTAKPTPTAKPMSSMPKTTATVGSVPVPTLSGPDVVYRQWLTDCRLHLSALRSGSYVTPAGFADVSAQNAFSFPLLTISDDQPLCFVIMDAEAFILGFVGADETRYLFAGGDETEDAPPAQATKKKPPKKMPAANSRAAQRRGGVLPARDERRAPVILPMTCNYSSLLRGSDEPDVLSSAAVRAAISGIATALGEGIPPDGFDCAVLIFALSEAMRFPVVRNDLGRAFATEDSHVPYRPRKDLLLNDWVQLGDRASRHVDLKHTATAQKRLVPSHLDHPVMTSASDWIVSQGGDVATRRQLAAYMRNHVVPRLSCWPTGQDVLKTLRGHFNAKPEVPSAHLHELIESALSAYCLGFRLFEPEWHRQGFESVEHAFGALDALFEETGGENWTTPSYKKTPTPKIPVIRFEDLREAAKTRAVPAVFVNLVQDVHDALERGEVYDMPKEGLLDDVPGQLRCWHQNSVGSLPRHPKGVPALDGEPWEGTRAKPAHWIHTILADRPPDKGVSHKGGHPTPYLEYTGVPLGDDFHNPRLVLDATTGDVFVTFSHYQGRLPKGEPGAAGDDPALWPEGTRSPWFHIKW